MLTRFFDAFNRGDEAALATFFSDEPGKFQWYSVTEGQEGDPFFRHANARGRTDLLAYFRQRHDQHERLALRDVAIGTGWQAGVGNILYDVARTADDLPPDYGGPEHIAFGKGAINCAEQTILVWSMAMNARGSRDPVR